MAVLVPVALTGAMHTSVWIVLPPVLAALATLMAAAMSVDYFGLARRRAGWGGFTPAPARCVWTRAQALERRFTREKALGSPRTSWTARSLLVTLAECDRLGDAAAVVDFLCADAIYNRVGADPLADALRAIALAELGRVGEARRICDELERARNVGRLPVVAYATASVALFDHRPADALRGLDQALGRPIADVDHRDLSILRARVLASMARISDAADLLSSLIARGFRGELEQLAERAHTRGDSGLVMATRQALGEAAPYR